MVSFWNAMRLRKSRLLLVILLLLSLPTTAEATLEPLLGLFFSILTFVQDILQSVLEFFGIEAFPYGTCADCFCIPSPGETCPAEIPPTNFDALVPELRSVSWSNPYTLDCDPTQDPACDTTPPLQDGGACVVEFSAPPDDSSSTCPENWSYTLSTFPGTLAEAQADSQRLVRDARRTLWHVFLSAGSGRLHGTGAQPARSLLCLRRVWAAGPGGRY